MMAARPALARPSLGPCCPCPWPPDPCLLLPPPVPPPGAGHPDACQPPRGGVRGGAAHGLGAAHAPRRGLRRKRSFSILNCSTHFCPFFWANFRIFYSWAASPCIPLGTLCLAQGTLFKGCSTQETPGARAALSSDVCAPPFSRFFSSWAASPGAPCLPCALPFPLLGCFPWRSSFALHSSFFPC